jgi:DNA-binding NarL/FixJ family response regulator
MQSTVLVVNDDHELSSLLEQVLRADPRLIVVGKARTPIAAQALSWEMAPDAIIVEQHDVGITWWDELARLRRYCADSCLVLLTDRDRDELPTVVKLVDHVLPRTTPWRDLADLVVPPVCEDEVDEPLPIAQ